MNRQIRYIIIALILTALPSVAQTSLLNPNNYTSLAASFNPGGNVTVNMATNQLTISGGATYAGYVESGITIFTFDDFTLPASRTITFMNVPSLGNKVAFLSKGNMTITGSINASASSISGAPSIPGPGGGAGAAISLYELMNGEGPGGGIGGANSAPQWGASCGGGFGGRGGGSFDYHTSASTDGLGSGPYGDLSTALQGGSGGGHGYFAGKAVFSVADGAHPAYGGSGGGAIALGARGNIVFQTGSSVLAKGADGEAAVQTAHDGTGGGSGGGILIFGNSVSIQSGALISVKGGNGGTGGSAGGYGGGAGGGGRISIYYYTTGTYSNSGTVEVLGGTGGTDNANPGDNGGNGVLVTQPSSSTILPVELVSFNAAANKKAVSLNWTTATEVNNYGFEVERKSSEWEKIGFVKGHGNSNSPINYSFTDEHPVYGTVQYRLKQVDNNGDFKYYEAVSVKCTAPAAVLQQNHPNPFNPVTVIAYSLPFDAQVNIKVYNVIGEKVKDLVDEVKPAGYNEVTFNGGNLPSGLYIYSVTAFSHDGKEKFSDVKKMMLAK